ncbi:hypothetical protein NIES22_65700 [Calothrix brevissima NIES-22]|nr:hypothetical protein NIES22_65700 [Calothrix brevissima NIES-22]
MRIFTIVSRPNYQDLNRRKEWIKFFPTYNEKSFSTRLRANSDPLREAVKTLKTLEKKNVESEFSLELTHPNSPTLSTVCIWKHQERDNRYYVKDLADLTAFNSTNRNNLLYLPTLREKKLIDFHNISDDVNYRYRVIEPKELGFPDSLFSKKSDVSGVFFKQVESDEGVNPEIINLEEIKEDSENKYHAVGWLNPVIFTLDVDGNDIENIENANKNEYLNALSLFLDQLSIILVEPHIDESYDLRISFLIKLNQIIQERQQSKANNKNFSLIEYILLGSQYPQPWKPFLTLDLLGGEFYAYQNVNENVNETREQETPLVGWKSPQDAKSNKRWFSDYWLKKWVNSPEINTQSQVNVVSPPSLARLYRSSRGLVTFQVEDLSEDANPSLTSLLKGHPLYISDPKKNNPYRFLVELFKNSEFQEYSEKFPYNNFWYRSNQDNKSQDNKLVKFDDVDFWNYFSKIHFVPESSILIAIPNQDNRFLDPINSINYGAYHFLWELFNCFDSVREQELVEFDNNFGWWNDWHSSIFNERWDVSLKFIKHSGFVINKSLLGSKDCLGLKIKVVDWKYPKMSFSIPTRKNYL